MGLLDRLIGRRAPALVPAMPARPRAASAVDAVAPLLPPAQPVRAAFEDSPPQQQALREVFTPTRPQRSSRRVAGRQMELLRIFRAVALDRAHVVLYGERGRGKTSLVNLVAAAARNAGYMVARTSCAVGSDFDGIMRGLVRDLPASLLAVAAQGDAVLEGCEAALPPGRLQPRDIVTLPGRLSGRRLLLIADEFDRVEDETTRTLLADTIKQVSDRGVALSFIIVGVSDSLEELLGRHPSIQRNILALPLPLLSDADIGTILEQARRDAGIEFPAEIRQRIAAVACGVPYLAQLLGLHAGVQATTRGAASVSAADLEAACRLAVDEADPRLASVYEGLTRGGRDRAMRAALTVVAGGEQDRFGRFRTDMDAQEVAGSPVDPALWQRLLDSGAVRACLSAGPDAFTFTEALFRHYILLRDAIEPARAPVSHTMKVAAE